MRTRYLNPHFFENEKLAQLGPEAMLLFAGLWCEADREGRLKDCPPVLKGKILPFFNSDVITLLDMLDGEFIIRYHDGNGNSFIQIINFLKYQHVHPHEAKSVIPPYDPNIHQTKMSRNVTTLVDQRTTNVSECKSLTSFPSLSSLTSCIPPIIPPTGGDRPFADFWEIYPRRPNGNRGSKAISMKRWRKLSRADQDAAIASIPVFMKTDKWRDGYNNEAQVFLNQRQWDDLPVIGKPCATCDGKGWYYREWSDDATGRSMKRQKQPCDKCGARPEGLIDYDTVETIT